MWSFRLFADANKEQTEDISSYVNKLSLFKKNDGDDQLLTAKSS